MIIDRCARDGEKLGKGMGRGDTAVGRVERAPEEPVRELGKGPAFDPGLKLILT